MDRSLKQYTNGRSSFWSYDSSRERSYAFRSNIHYIQNFGANTDVFGEYKIALDNIDYLYCDDGKRKKGDSNGRICESNFMLTNPYTVQKTPS
jgi:hypothetical protein